MINSSIETKAEMLSSFNPAAAELLLALDKAETGSEVAEALDSYDQATSED